MGVRLIVEILDNAPADMSAAERLLLIALAEKASDQTRQVLWRKNEDPREVLAGRVGVSPAGLTKVFGRLASRGLDPRVPLRTDRQGRPVFAFVGTLGRYRVPVLAPARGSPGGDPLEPERCDERGPLEGSLAGTLGGTGRDPLEPERVPARGPLFPPSLRSPSSEGAPSAAAAPPAAHRAAIIRLLTLGPEIGEQQAIAAVAAVIAKKNPDNPAAYVGRFSVEDVQRWAGATNQSTATSNACSHGIAGGMHIIGRNEHASRVCGDCETDLPAVEVTHLAALPTKPQADDTPDDTWSLDSEPDDADATSRRHTG